MSVLDSFGTCEGRIDAASLRAEVEQQLQDHR